MFPTSPAGAIPAACTVARSTGVTGPTKPRLDVGQVAHDPIAAEQELDRRIAEQLEREKQAYENGDPQGARLYLKQATALIQSRTPEHQARLTAAVERRIDEGVDYMQWQARLDAEMLAKKEGADA